MVVDRTRLHNNADDFFLLGGSVVMTLTREAAIEVMLRAADYGQLVLGYEAGIWHHPGFEARLDGIASTQSQYATSPADVAANNERMVGILASEEPPDYDVVIVTTQKVFDPAPTEQTCPREYIA